MQLFELGKFRVETRQQRCCSVAAGKRGGDNFLRRCDIFLESIRYFSKRGDVPYTDVAYRPGDVLVFGDEARGLPESLLSGAADRTLRIPIRPEVRSLNLSNAVAVALYEAVRQIEQADRGI